MTDPSIPATLPHAPTSVVTLSLPGWRGSGPGHWQTLWEQQHGHRRVEQDDWIWPRRGDWSARLEDVISAVDAPVRLVAHSLGCLLAASWAAHTRHASRVQSALLVAPPDTTRPDLPPQLRTWRDPPREALPFATCVVASSNDVYAGLDYAQALAQDWGAHFIHAGPRGHLNADSGLADWPEGLALFPPPRRPVPAG